MKKINECKYIVEIRKNDDVEPNQYYWVAEPQEKVGIYAIFYSNRYNYTAAKAQDAFTAFAKLNGIKEYEFKIKT